MESFFSLFEPSAAESGPRARRRRRGGGGAGDAAGGAAGAGACGSGKAHAPEESSFLCEPDISSSLLVKDVGYIDSYIDMKYARADDETNTEVMKKPEDLKRAEELKKKRSSGRKSRRKKKSSPPKEFVPRQCWNEENLFYPEFYNNCRDTDEKVNNWNNKHGAWRQRNIDNLGKNVNDLQRTPSVEVAAVVERAAEVERAGEGACEETCWAREITASESTLRLDSEPRELDADVFYSSDEENGNLIDTSSDLDEDSSGEVYGSLPPEPQLGNVEYKLQLVAPSDKRFQHLVTQLKWRLRSGGGGAVYVVGVRDCGALRGLRARALRASLRTLRAMAAALRASVRRVAARRVAPHRAVAEVYIRKLADTQQSVELRVAVMGADEAGKSTLIGVLTQGELDNGRGSARLNMFRHLHEVRSGRTSSLSHEILGFDAQGDVVNYGCSELMTAERIGERSAKLVSFLDLAGHSKYQRTTVHGLTGYSPHYAMLVVSATAGISRMTEEHLGLLLALDLPFFVVVTRVELAPAEPLALLARIQEILRAAGCQKRPLLITSEQQARTCATPTHTPILDKLDKSDDADEDTDKLEEAVPVFPVSCVSGEGLNALHSYLLAAEPPPDPLSHLQPDPEEEAVEFQVDEIFRVGGAREPVVGGLLARGVLHEGDTLLIGPLDSGDFVPITVRTIYRNRVPCGSVRAGRSASLGLSRRPPTLRQGMVLLGVPAGYVPPDDPPDAVPDTDDAVAETCDDASLFDDGTAEKDVSFAKNADSCFINGINKLEDDGNSLFENSLNDDLSLFDNVSHKLDTISDSFDDLSLFGNSTLESNGCSVNGSPKKSNVSSGSKLQDKNEDKFDSNVDNNVCKISPKNKNNNFCKANGFLDNKNRHVADTDSPARNRNNTVTNSINERKNSEVSSINTLPDYKNLFTVPDHHMNQANNNYKYNSNNNEQINSSNIPKINVESKIESINTLPDYKNLFTVPDHHLNQANNIYKYNSNNNEQKYDSSNIAKINVESKIDRIHLQRQIQLNKSKPNVVSTSGPANPNLKTSPNPRIDVTSVLSGSPLGAVEASTSSESEAPEHGGTQLDRRKAQRAQRWDVKSFKRKEKNLLRDIARAKSGLAKNTAGDVAGNLYRSDSDSEAAVEAAAAAEAAATAAAAAAAEAAADSSDEVPLDDPADPRGSFYFQATVRVLRHSTAIYPGFQTTVHIGNIRQTAVIEGIMSSNSVLRAGESASVVFRFVRQPEYVCVGRKVLFRAGLETRGVGRLTQVFPCARRKLLGAA